MTIHFHMGNCNQTWYRILTVVKVNAVGFITRDVYMIVFRVGCITVVDAFHCGSTGMVEGTDSYVLENDGNFLHNLPSSQTTAS